MTRFRLTLVFALGAAVLVGGCSPETREQIRDTAATAAAEAGPTLQAAAGTAVAEAGPTLQAAGTSVAGMLADVGSPAKPLVMSFVPSGEQEAIATGSEEIKRLLEAETGLTINPNIATSYAAVIEAMGAGNAHVGWMPTFAYLLANEKYGVTPMLVVERSGSTTYAGQVVTGADSGITSVADLAGKKFCRPDALSTSGWIAPSIALKKAGVNLDDLELVDAGSHDQVIIQVYNGQCDAGATFEDARDRVAETYPDVKEKVSVLTVSDPIPNDNVSAIAGLSPATVKKVQDGLLALAATAEGKAALQQVYGIEVLQPVQDSFYDDFRATLAAAGVDPQDYVK